MSKKNVIVYLLALLLFGMPVLNLNAQSSPTGKDMGQGHCSAHGHYYGMTCPTCARSVSGGATGGSYSDARLQAVQSMVPVIMELFKKDPKKQQAQLEAQQRELNR